MKKISLILPLLLFSVTALVRSYNLPQTFMFAEDQEDISFRVKQIIVDQQPTLISAKFSQIGLYLGPGYLYFLVPFFLLTQFHPLAAMIVIVFLAASTGLGLFFTGLTLANRRTGFLAWLIYTFSLTIHQYDRIFWNPNLILPAITLGLLALAKLYKRQRQWLLVIPLASGISLQSHPQGVGLTIFLILALISLKQKLSLKLKDWVLIGAGILLFISPLIIFELRHHFIVSQTLTNYLKNNFPGQKGFIWRPYYGLFILSPLILLLSLLLNQLTKKNILKKIIYLVIIFWAIKNSLTIFRPAIRQDGLVLKIAAASYAMNLINSHSISQVQFNMSSEGMRYIFWYLSQEKNMPSVNFYESWNQVSLPKIIFQSPPSNSKSGKVFGNIQVTIYEKK